MFEILPSQLLHQLTYDSLEPMVFTSGIFLWAFLVFSGVYAYLKRRDTARIIFVTLFSYYFYYKCSGFYFLALAFVTVSDFYLAKLIARQADGKTGIKRLLLAASVGIDLSLLGYFKYTNFFGSLLISGWNDLDIFLPVGVSFFTFQSLSYSIDIYRGKIKPLNSLLDYAFYISFFPQLVAGPIVRASDFIPQIRKALLVTNEMFGRGAYLIMLGLFKKAVISDYICTNFVDRIFEQPSLYTGIENLLAVYGYTLQIYCDFSGYSDIAIGIALWLGFHFPDNFKSPYKSASITEFWRRWHISLSSWLRDYLYISLGGNRKGKLRQYINLMITMLLGGLWHGASLNFLLWGGIHGFMLCIDKLWMKFKPSLSPLLLLKNDTAAAVKNPRLLRLVSQFITFHIVCLCWVLFRSKDFNMASEVLGKIFNDMNLSILSEWIIDYYEIALLMVIGYAMHFCPDSIVAKLKNFIINSHMAVKVVIFVAIIWLVFQVKNADIQPFIYFQF